MIIVTIFSVLFAVAAVLADDECDVVSPYQKCLHYVPRDKLNEINVVPDKDELMSICPGELMYFECFTDHLDDCGRMNEHFPVVEFMENSYELAKDLCNEQSNLHKAYVASAECYKTLEGAGDDCEAEAKEIYGAYFEFLKEVHPGRIEAVHKSSQKICMIQSYKTACLSERVLKECGESAQTTFMEIMSRSQYLRQFCSQSMVEELQTTFLSLLDMEEDDLEVYKNAFYVMK